MPTESLPEGLTRAEAGRRRDADGANTIGEIAARPLHDVASKFWAPVPWLLEAAAVLQAVLHEYVQAAIVIALLVSNAALAYVQGGRSEKILDALRSKLAPNASVKRDGHWSIIAAAELVRGDVIRLSLGGVVAADVRVASGEVSLDESMLSGESHPVEAAAGAVAHAGALIERGEAIGEVIATGERTQFGTIARTIRTVSAESTQQKAVLRVVRNLAIFNGAVTVCLSIDAAVLHLPPAETISLVLTAVLASIPVALPATFTLAATVAASVLGAEGVLPTRLAAVDEAASMDVLCTDKTGTLTQNTTTVTEVVAMASFDIPLVLALAARASSEGGSDPVDAAVRRAAASGGATLAGVVESFVPFDPASRTSEAIASGEVGAPDRRIVEGRVLAVATGTVDKLYLAGLIALGDPPRSDSAALIARLGTLGVRTIMVTGDAATTAVAVARAIGLETTIGPGLPLAANVPAERYAIYAAVAPEDKFALVRVLQGEGHVVGMCGDGANDAPALRQAQMGIAVATATDVAKSAAGLVLTTPGLSGIDSSIVQGRLAFQRIQKYTLTSVIKKMQTGLFLAVGLIVTGHAVITPMSIVILMVVGDVLAMSRTTDNVVPSARPNVWNTRQLTVAGAFIGALLLAFCSALLAFGYFRLHLTPAIVQTLTFVMLAATGQATLYAIREPGLRFRLAPSRALLLSSAADLIVTSGFATNGLLMAPASWQLVAGVLLACALFGVALDVAKVPLFARLGVI